MTRTTCNPWLNRFAVLTAGATFALVGAGGLVTSHGAGMAVPDWPTTYGYNMFLFPPSYWIGGIFYEHTHRLLASFVGLLTTVLAVWLWLKEARPWLRWLGVAAFVGVVLQGVLGGLRVTLFKDQIGIFHAALAQIFLALVSLIALFTSEFWDRNDGLAERTRLATGGWRYLLGVGLLLVFIQLLLGASMRHQHAGLAVPDFPLAYGKIWPSLDTATLDAINRGRLDTRDQNPITAFHITLHMAHRIGAILTLLVAGWLAWGMRKQLGTGARLSKIAAAWLGLILLQAVLGAATVWSNKAADVATAHVMLGAASLVLGTILTVTALRPAVEISPSMLTAATRRPANSLPGSNAAASPI